MRPASENQQALADTAAYAEELVQADVTGVVGFAAGCGFARGRMVTPEQLEMAARQWVSSTPGTVAHFENMSDHRRDILLQRLRGALRSAGFTVLDPPP